MTWRRSTSTGCWQQHGGNRKQVAAALGVSERTLYRKLKRYALG